MAAPARVGAASEQVTLLSGLGTERSRRPNWALLQRVITTLLCIVINVCNKWLFLIDFYHASSDSLKHNESPFARFDMRFFENWWERGPVLLRLGLILASLLAVVLGGSADHYWE